MSGMTAYTARRLAAALHAAARHLAPVPRPGSGKGTTIRR